MKANSKLNIIHIDTALEWRGGQQQLFYLATGMFHNGHQVSVACPKTSQLWQRLSEIGVPCISIPPRWSLKAIWTLRSLKPDCFAAHTSHAHGMCIFLSRPFIVHRRVDFIPNSPWKYSKANAFICVSSAVKNIIETHCPKAKAYCVHDGVPIVSLPGKTLDSYPLSVLAVGACVPHKGHDVLSQASALLPDTEFYVAGEGPCRYPNLNYLGYQPDVGALMRKARLIVHPSREEGLGQSVIEAMMLGCELVVSDAGGLPELVGDTARVVPKEDSQALANAIHEILKEKPALNYAAHNRAKTLFSCQTMIDNTIQVYESVLQNSTLRS